MKKTKNEKLSLTTVTVRKLSDQQLKDMAGASFSGCLYLTKPTTVTNGCQ